MSTPDPDLRRPGSADFWKQIFEEGQTPDGQKVLGQRLDLIKMIQSRDGQG